MRRDVLAALTVAIVALPLSMAIAVASGVTPERGLYTAIVGGALVSLLGGSRYQIGGPAGAFIVLVAATVARVGVDGLLLAVFLSGVLLTLLGVFRVGGLIRLIPHAVTVGFTCGIAATIAASQLKDFAGLSLSGKEPGPFFPKLAALLHAVPSLTPAALLLGAATTLIIAVLANKHQLGHRERLRERFTKGGANALPDYEMLELVLFAAIPRRDVKPLAKDLLTRFGSFAEVIAAPRDRLLEIDGIGENVVTQLKIIEAAALRLSKTKLIGKHALSSWQALLDYCKAAMARTVREEFRVLFLDRKNVLIADEVQSAGTVNHTPVYPREIVKRALEHSASALILVHNHPSGDPTCSVPFWTDIPGEPGSNSSRTWTSSRPMTISSVMS
ncbi:MAG: DNA repair protein RadC [Rhizomicrobium sp.]